MVKNYTNVDIDTILKKYTNTMLKNYTYSKKLCIIKRAH